MTDSVLVGYTRTLQHSFMMSMDVDGIGPSIVRWFVSRVGYSTQMSGVLPPCPLIGGRPVVSRDPTGCGKGGSPSMPE